MENTKEPDNSRCKNTLMNEKRTNDQNQSPDSDEDFFLRPTNQKSFELQQLMKNQKFETHRAEESSEIIKIFKRRTEMDVLTAIFCLIGLVCAISSYDTEFEGTDTFKVRWRLSFMLGTTTLAIVFNYLFQVENINLLKAKNKLSENSTIVSSGEFRKLILESIILLLGPYPFFVGIKITSYNRFHNVDLYYYLNDFFYILMLLRMYFFVRLILNLSPYRSARAHRLCDLHGIQNNYVYAIKCAMRDNPSIITLIILVVSIFYFGYALRIAERPLNRYSEDIVPMDYTFYLNGVWCVLITLCTVGYGDYYARTVLGRAVILCVCIWGVYVVSLVVVALNTFLTLSKVEERSKSNLDMLDLKDQLKQEASLVIRNSILLSRNNPKDDTFEKGQNEEEIVGEIQKNLINVNTLNRELRVISDEPGDENNSNETIRNELRQYDKNYSEKLASIEKRQEAIEEVLNQICQKLGVSGIPNRK